jgi:dynactin complex subunit
MNNDDLINENNMLKEKIVKLENELEETKAHLKNIQHLHKINVLK